MAPHVTDRPTCKVAPCRRLVPKASPIGQTCQQEPEIRAATMWFINRTSYISDSSDKSFDVCDGSLA